MLYAIPNMPPHIEMVQMKSSSVSDLEPRILQIQTREVDTTISRDEIILRAKREGLSRGWTGDPIIVSETIVKDGILFLLEFPLNPIIAPPKPNTTNNSTSGNVQSKGQWVLVVPVEDVGGKAIWDRGTNWGKSWIVPIRQDGIQMIATTGDSEDKENLTIAGLTNPNGATSGVGKLVRKYSAPYLAILKLQNDGFIHAWLWRNGSVQTDMVDFDSENLSLNRKKGAELISRMISNKKTDVTTTAQGDISPMLSITILRSNSQNEMQFEILCDTSDADEHTVAKQMTQNIPNMKISNYKLTDNGLLISGIWTGTRYDMEQALTNAGATIIR